MLDNLPDHIVLQMLRNLSYGDRLRMEMVSRRYHNLLNSVWSEKRDITLPYDLLEINRKFTFSSYWDKFGNEVTSLIEHCPNITKLYFKTFRHLQIFPQSASFLYFSRFISDEPGSPFQLREVHFGKLYITDRHVFEIMATVFPSLTKLTVEEPYPLLYAIRPDTTRFLESRVENLQPGLNALLEDNNRVTEDIRHLIQLFPHLETLTVKDATFRIISDRVRP